MKVRNKIAVITGGASGIGAALARRFHAEGAKGIAVADVQEELLSEVAAEVGGIAVPCNVTSESDILSCPDCKAKLRVPLEKRPVRARCPACKTEFMAHSN